MLQHGFGLFIPVDHHQQRPLEGLPKQYKVERFGRIRKAGQRKLLALAALEFAYEFLKCRMPANTFEQITDSGMRHALRFRI
jgi:hypothetical protein